MALHVGPWATILPKVTQQSTAKPIRMWRMCSSRLECYVKWGTGSASIAGKPSHGHHTLLRQKGEAHFCRHYVTPARKKSCPQHYSLPRSINAGKNMLHNIRGHMWGNTSCRAHRCMCGVQHWNAHIASSHVGKAMLGIMSAWDSCIAWQCMQQPPTVRATQLEPASHEHLGYTRHAATVAAREERSHVIDRAEVPS
jgi:hypothetical protein